jgi:hypothetical protein
MRSLPLQLNFTEKHYCQPEVHHGKQKTNQQERFAIQIHFGEYPDAKHLQRQTNGQRHKCQHSQAASHQPVAGVKQSKPDDSRRGTVDDERRQGVDDELGKDRDVEAKNRDGGVVLNIRRND